jgi:hypothetical protein
MIPTLGETLLALAGLWRFAREGAPALRWFDRSMAGFWRSFGVAVIAAPLQAMLIATQTAVPADAAGWFRLIAVEASAYVILWVAFPLVLFHIATRLDRVPHYIDFVIIYNWSNIPILAISLLVSLLLGEGGLPDGLMQVVAGLIYIGILSFEWFIARQTLRLGGLACAGLVLLDFAITILVESAVASMT